MGLLDSILGAVSGKSGAPGEANPLIAVLGGLLAQSGGLQGLASNQVQNVLGSEQVNAIATRMGVDPAMASAFLAEYLPKIVDKLTPAGKIDPAADHRQGLAAMLPSLLQSLAGQSSTD